MQTRLHAIDKTPTDLYYPLDGKIYKRTEVRELEAKKVFHEFAKHYGVAPYNFEPSPAQRIYIDEIIDARLENMPSVRLSYTEYKTVQTTPGALEHFLDKNENSASETVEKKAKVELKSEEERAEDADESYENSYGLINQDVEDPLYELFEADESGQTAADVIAEIEDWGVMYCKEQLASISPANYGENERTNFILLNYRLSILGVAPRWRGMMRDRHYKSVKQARTAQQDAYMRDVQAFDLEWLYRRYPGHQVDTTWNGVFEGIFTSSTFDTKKASTIAGMSLTPAKKAEFLMLTPDMEKELFMIRSKATDREMKGLLDKSKRVHVDLNTSAQRNRRRGKRLVDNLGRRVNLWIAAKIAPGGSLTTTMENYFLMTGESLSKSNCKRLLKSLNDALCEVGSKYALD